MTMSDFDEIDSEDLFGEHESLFLHTHSVMSKFLCTF